MTNCTYSLEYKDPLSVKLMEAARLYESQTQAKMYHLKRERLFTMNCRLQMFFKTSISCQSLYLSIIYCTIYQNKISFQYWFTSIAGFYWLASSVQIFKGYLLSFQVLVISRFRVSDPTQSKFERLLLNLSKWRHKGKLEISVENQVLK